MVAVALVLPTLSVPYMLDDYMHVLTLERYRDAVDSETTHRISARDHFGLPTLFAFVSHHAKDTTVLPWWHDPDLRLMFWRPLSSLTAALDFAIAGRNPVFAHAQNLLWAVAMGLSASAVYRRVLTPTLATASALLFVVAPTHVFATIWLANRSTLIAVTLGAWALWFHLRWRADSHGRHLAGSMIMAALALLGGEIGLSMVAYIVAFQLVGESGAWRRRLTGALPVAGVVAAWAVHYIANGFGANGSGMYVSPAADLGRFFGLAVTRGSILVGSLLGVVPADFAIVKAVRPWLLAQGLVVVVGVTIAIRRLWPSFDTSQRRALRFLGLGSLLSIVPVCATYPAARLLVPASLGVVVVVALLIAHGLRSPKPHWRALGWLGLGPHVLLALILWPAQIIALSGMSAKAEHVARAVPSASHAKTALVVGCSDVSLALGLPSLRLFLGLDIGPRWTLATSSLADHRISRPNPSTLTIDLERHGDTAYMFGAMIDDLFRDVVTRPFVDGDVVRRDGYTVRVRNVHDGRPGRVGFEFDATLEDAGVQLLVWDGDALVDDGLPAVGETRFVPWRPGPFGF